MRRRIFLSRIISSSVMPALRGRQEIVESSLALVEGDSQAPNRCRSLFECLILMPSVSGTPNYRRILMREGAGFLLRRRRVLRVMVVLPRFRGRPALRPAQSVGV